MSSLRQLCLLAVALAVLAYAPAAAADEANDPASVKASADAMMDSRRYAEAAHLYGRLYELSADPVALYNEGRALEALGEYPEAVERLERFRDVAPPALRSKTKGLDDHIEDLRSRVATLVVVTSVRGARLLVRGKDAGAIEGTLETRVRAGTATIEVTAAGYEPYKRELDLRAKSTERIDVELTPRASAILSVRTKPADAAIEIDGQARGSAPLEIQVSPGAHVVVATKPGLGEARADVTVRTGERRELELSVGGGSITSQWWFWTGLGVLAAGALTVVVVAVASGGDEPTTGDFSPGRISAPLRLSF
jgi:hypothetical protein